MKHRTQIRLSQCLCPQEHSQSVFSWLVTCYEADGGAVTAAQLWVPPGHHGDPEIVIPSRQQVGYSLQRDKTQRAAQERTHQHKAGLLKHNSIYKPHWNSFFWAPIPSFSGNLWNLAFQFTKKVCARGVNTVGMLLIHIHFVTGSAHHGDVKGFPGW